MVKIARFVPPAFAVLLSASAVAKDLASYQLGDVAESDIITPIQLTVVDVEATAALKQKEGQRVPVVVRFQTFAAEKASETVRQTFDDTRISFLDAVEKTFRKRVLTSDELASARFHSLAVNFERTAKFPVHTNRAALWASGDADEAYRNSLASEVRNAMKLPIRPENVPGDLRLGNTIRLISSSRPGELISLKTVEERGSNFARSNLVILANLRRELQANYIAEERVVGRFLSMLIEPNCAVDAELTQQARAKRTEAMWAADNYAPGQVIAKRGQVIDPKIKAALERLHERLAVGQLQQMVVTDQVKTAQINERMRWVIGTSIGACLLLIIIAWAFARRRPATLLPAVLPGTPLNALPPGETLPESAWQQRALVAEHRIEKTQAAVRAGVIAQLARWMSQMFVQRLANQRADLLDTQHRAAMEMAELEARLDKIQAPLQDRLTAYEKRIAELEKELAMKGEENRELIKTKIQLVKKQLEIEREKTRVEFN